MADAGQKMPFIKQIRFQFERESIPVWIKFLQGYYDTSGIPSDMYDAAVNMETNGDMGLSPEMAEKGMQMISSVSATSFYLGFNMLDPVIGGMDPKQKKLRQAISIVLDYQEYIDIFMNGRGVMSQSILAPGIYGCQEGKHRREGRTADMGWRTLLSVPSRNLHDAGEDKARQSQERSRIARIGILGRCRSGYQECEISCRRG